MEAEDHYKSVHFYIERLRELKRELRKYESEYEPEKVRSLICAYKFTLRKILYNGEAFLAIEKEDWDKLNEIDRIIIKYRDHLKSL